MTDADVPWDSRMHLVAQLLATVTARATDEVASIVELSEVVREHQQLRDELAAEPHFPGKSLRMLLLGVHVRNLRATAVKLEDAVWEQRPAAAD